MIDDVLEKLNLRRISKEKEKEEHKEKDGPAGNERPWPGRLLTYFRFAAGITALSVSYSIASDPALHEAIFLLGLFIVGHVAVELFIIGLPGSPRTTKSSRDPFNLVANALVTTPAVILGLLAALAGTGKLTVVVKVAAVSLTAALLLGIVASGFASMQGIESAPRSVIIKVTFNLTLWALALGILGIAMGIVYRT